MKELFDKLFEEIKHGDQEHQDWLKQKIDNFYKENKLEKISFGAAIEGLKMGYKVAREGWNGKGMFLRIVQDGKIIHEGQERTLDSFIAMKTVQDTLVPWLASQTDMLAEDWSVIIE